MAYEHLIVLVTAPDEKTAQTIAQTLLEKKLIACANIVPAVQSLFWWQEEIENEDEVLLLLKTRAVLFEQLASAIRAVHPYQVPEIIALPVVMGSADYLSWIDQSTGEAQ